MGELLPVMIIPVFIDVLSFLLQKSAEILSVFELL